LFQVTRRPHYRITVVDRLPRLKILDLIEISEDDRAKSEIFFSEQYQQQLQQMQPQIIFNTTSNYTTQAQLITSYNQTQIDSNQFIQSPRLKPILFMDKMISNNFGSNFGSNATSGNTNTNNNNNLQNNSSKSKTKPNLNYEKLAKEFQSKHRSQF
jgi:hypothetical protein